MPKTGIRRRGDAGLTVLNIANQNGKTPIVDLLVKSGAKAGPETPAGALKPKQRNSIRAAVQDSLPCCARILILRKCRVLFLP